MERETQLPHKEGKRMRISELIDRLSKYEDAYGNLLVYFIDYNNKEFLISDLDYERPVRNDETIVLPQRIVLN
jgi:hypothetical protein